ncbi:periplasmic thioredoxin of cytochrome c-type biogenesis [Burkholderiales bacterium]|jgi:cytochrome c biogenesis protein CcmG, thiol:disulfide interchange protein DsbE|nr:periplasmic thioredoxin of cytochrome c-type biogenesis [Burkholderiales bacterium]
MSSMRKSLAFLLPLAVFLAIAVFLFKGLWLDPREIPSPLIDKPAPDFRLESLEKPGRLVDRKDMLGKVWLLNAWASWCVACREEHPVLIEFARSATIPIIGLNYKDTRVDGMRWLAQFGNPYTTSAYDEAGRVGIDYGVYAVPETFLIDKQGVVRFKQIGPVTPELLREKILPLIQRLNA